MVPGPWARIRKRLLGDARLGDLNCGAEIELTLGSEVCHLVVRLFTFTHKKARLHIVNMHL